MDIVYIGCKSSDGQIFPFWGCKASNVLHVQFLRCGLCCLSFQGRLPVVVSVPLEWMLKFSWLISAANLSFNRPQKSGPGDFFSPFELPVVQAPFCRQDLRIQSKGATKNSDIFSPLLPLHGCVYWRHKLIIQDSLCKIGSKRWTACWLCKVQDVQSWGV